MFNCVVTEEMIQAQESIDAKLKRQSMHTEKVTSNKVRRLLISINSLYIIKQLKLNASPCTRRDYSGAFDIIMLWAVKLLVTCPTC